MDFVPRLVLNARATRALGPPGRGGRTPGRKKGQRRSWRLAEGRARETHAVREPEFITTAARRFGSQCVVVSIDYKRGLSGNRVMAANGTSNTARDPLEWAREVEQRGAGEIFLTSIDRDGTGRGYDIDTLRAVVDAVRIPVIASGGVGEFQHLTDGIEKGGASAVSAANIFHYIGNGLVKAKQHMISKGASVPMWNFW